MSEASRIALGMMRIENLSAGEIRELYTGARDAGVTLFDHADIYGGGEHGCERRFSEALQLGATEREQIVLQTKCGIRPGGKGFDFSADYIVRRAEESLEALGTDYLDVLMLHRPDTLVEPEEVASAFSQLESAGKVRAFGVSNHTAQQIELLKTAVTQPLAVNQVQFGLGHAALVAQGIAANMEGVKQSAMRDGGLIEYARINGITLEAWSPFQRGFFSGSIFEQGGLRELQTVIARMAAERETTPTAIATAWITRHPARMRVVLGTTKASRVAEAVEGAGMVLSRAEWYELFAAAGYEVP
ncbi:aldo/keto reductase [Leucobacter aridicollis]|uniref:Putative oxidoreductase n=1 Tax=Leucobacter aridicollis TaxID=283878 RepID=A0A852RAN9_9MICO|nr:aldo/keto reductase [Leucobacter aridicollis]MBL3682542.1 aldo/keto reductase family oxidoreductase [Leucobacter aridicollis]NYD25960.1 putative oxidoreductase [Leucobacter aridicollis]